MGEDENADGGELQMKDSAEQEASAEVGIDPSMGGL